MAYEKQVWKDGEEGETPITADRLNHMEAGIAEKSERGPEGPPGPQGEPGKNGNDGKDGFGTEEQYNNIIQRLDALEGNVEGD